MTRFVVDADVVLRLATEGVNVPTKHELLAPTLVRSQTLSTLHEAVHRRELAEAEALERLRRVGRIKIRLLGDAVLRRNAWQIAGQLGWADTFTAEYIALTKLQADAFVTLDAKLAETVRDIVPTATYEDLL
jgi:predicted nucleic acid-binding protein